MFKPIKMDMKIQHLGDNYYGYKFSGNYLDMCIVKLGTEMIDVHEFSIKKINDIDCELKLVVSTDEEYTDFKHGYFNIRIDEKAFYPFYYNSDKVYTCTVANSNLLDIFKSKVNKYLKISLGFLFTREMAPYVNRIQNLRFEKIGVDNPELNYDEVVGFTTISYKFKKDEKEHTLGFYDRNIFYSLILDWLELTELFATKSKDKYYLFVNITKQSNLLNEFRDDNTNQIELSRIDIWINDRYYPIEVNSLRSGTIEISEDEYNTIKKFSNPVFIRCLLVEKEKSDNK